MTDDELKKIALKIAKCLALATSDNPAEAESAKRQANLLMRKYNLTVGDVAAADVHEEAIDTKGPYKIPVYLSQLAFIIANAFGCGVVCELGFISVFFQKKTDLAGAIAMLLLMRSVLW